MNWLIAKVFITAGIIVLVTEIAKRSDRLGGAIAALPLMTILTLIWLYVEKQPTEKIANHAFYTFWYVLPTLPMFLAFPFLLDKFGFWMSLVISTIITVICFVITAQISKSVFDIHLM